MPELPEVEAARRLVERNCLGKTITEAQVAEDEKVISGVAPQELGKALVGRTLAAARRRGKQMWWEFDAGPSLLLHFGMTGGLVVQGIGAAHYKSFVVDDSCWPPKYCKLELAFGDGTRLAFCDSRRFARVRFLDRPEGVPPISELGWDPLLDMPSLPSFAAQLGGQRRAIKAVLLDQSFSAGIGNWVADEVLYQARIHPEQPAHSVPQEQVAALHRAISHVCQVACEVEADSSRFPPDWLFHHRWGKGNSTPAKVGGRSIDHLTVGGRTSAFVPSLQKLDKAAAAGAVAAAGGGKKAGGGGKKKKAGAAAATQGKAAAAAAVAAASVMDDATGAAAVVAVAAARGAGKPRSARGKAAATTGEAAEAPTADAGGEQGLQQAGSTAASSRGRRGAAGSAAAAVPQPAAGSAGAVAGNGSKRFRAERRAAASSAPAGVAQGSAGGRKRKGQADGAADAAAAGAVAVSGRQGRARRVRQS